MAEKRQALVEAGQIERLIEVLHRRGYEVVGPTVRDAAIVYDRLEKLADLPVGWTDEQEAGSYRLKRREDGALFGYVVGPQSWKKYLHPADVRLFSAQRQGETFRILSNPDPPPPGRYALLCVRACELAAIAVQDRVLLHDRYRDPIYQGRREGIFIVAVNCTQPAATCFCTSMGTGPQAQAGFDLALTELLGPDHHQILIEVGSEVGAEVLAELEHFEASDDVEREAEQAVGRARSQIQRRMDTTGIRDLLYSNFDHPRWDDVAQRCLACANCTMVCPTCFCTTVEEVSDVTGDHAERWRRWDSCFSQSFSYIHGGSVRSSAKSRYRQWMTHKLASWIDQFGSSGCVGCGRCITWCPVGIDITGEVGALRGATASAGENDHGNT
ncbi:MAG: 4Fe-4S dicluster domain-containing protein [Candidatus Solibacter sp.]